jgi:hypothetical protein
MRSGLPTTSACPFSSGHSRGHRRAPQTSSSAEAVAGASSRTASGHPGGAAAHAAVLPRLHTAGVHELVGSGGTETPAKDSMEALLLKWGLHGHLPRDALTSKGDAKKNLSLLQVIAAWERALDTPGGFDAGDHRQAVMAALPNGESGAAVDGTAMPFSPVRPVV